MPSPILTAVHQLTIEIGEIPILIHTDSAEFAQLLAARYGEFVSSEPSHPVIKLDIDLMPSPALGCGPEFVEDEQELSVRLESGRWIIERGDYRAEWDPKSKQGFVRQTANPYATDGVLRILHSLVLACQGGFLVHAASAVRNGSAFVFAGVSGAGKTTLARLAPPDVTLLTDEISYVREIASQKPQDGHHIPRVNSRESAFGTKDSESRVPCPESRLPAFEAFGTPFAGELARIGTKVRAPLRTLFLLKQGPEDRIERLSEAEAARELLRHVLFFARDQELVDMVFQTVCDFVRRVPVHRLVFTPRARVWELIS